MICILREIMITIMDDYRMIISIWKRIRRFLFSYRKLIKFMCFFLKKKRIPILISFIVSKLYYDLQKKMIFNFSILFWWKRISKKLCFQIFHINLIKRVLEINHQSYQLLKISWMTIIKKWAFGFRFS